MTRRVVCFLLLALVAATCSAADLYSLEVDIRPADQAGNYLCLATVSDLATGEKLFSPKIAFRAGSQARAQSGSGNPTFELTVNIDPKTATATAQLHVRRGNKLVGSQRTSIQMK